MKNAGPVQERNVAVAILLSIVTCGIYGLYWWYKIEEDTAQLAHEQGNGAMVVLLNVVTCGIYGWVWIYRLAKDRMFRLTGRDNSKIGRAHAGITWPIRDYVPTPPPLPEEGPAPEDDGPFALHG